MGSKLAILRNLYIRDTTPWWLRTQYYIGNREIEATDWISYHKRRIYRLEKVLDAHYKYVNLVLWNARKVIRVQLSFIKNSKRWILNQ